MAFSEFLARLDEVQVLSFDSSFLKVYSFTMPWWKYFILGLIIDAALVLLIA